MLLPNRLVIGQENDSLKIVENRLVSLLSELRSAKNNEDRLAKNEVFKNELATALQIPESFTYPFGKLKTVGIIDSPDKLLRIVNWNIEMDDKSHQYTCFVLQIEKRTQELVFHELKDNSFGMPTQPDGILAENEWYGALYYRIIPVEKSGKTIYTLLGWDYYAQMSQVKLIDALYFTGKTLKLGSPIFKVGKEMKKRVFYEHSKKATMYLNYEADRKRIMMDHLSPETPGMNKFRSYYVPDLSYDAFYFEGGKWVLHEDVIGVNKAQEKKQTVYVKNEKTGKLEEKEIKTKWEDPSNPDAPAGSSVHVVVTPEEAVDKDKDKDEKSSEPKVNKRDKRDPSQLSTIGSSKKKRKK